MAQACGVKSLTPDRMARARLTLAAKRVKGGRETGFFARRGSLAAYLALSLPGGVFPVCGGASARARSTATTAKTTTAKTV